MNVSITDFNDNISYYIAKSKLEPVMLTKRGVVIAVIISKKAYDNGPKKIQNPA